MTRPTLSIALGALLLLGGPIAADAAPTAATAKVAEAAPQIHSAAAVERDEDAACSRARRRLWIQGEGWVVRRITTCR